MHCNAPIITLNSFSSESMSTWHPHHSVGLYTFCPKEIHHIRVLYTLNVDQLSVIFCIQCDDVPSWFFSCCAYNPMKRCAGSHAELIMHLCRCLSGRHKSGMHCHKWAYRHMPASAPHKSAIGIYRYRHPPDGGRLSAIWRLVTLPIDGASARDLQMGNLWIWAI